MTERLYNKRRISTFSSDGKLCKIEEYPYKEGIKPFVFEFKNGSLSEFKINCVQKECNIDEYHYFGSNNDSGKKDTTADYGLLEALMAIVKNM